MDKTLSSAPADGKTPQKRNCSVCEYGRLLGGAERFCAKHGFGVEDHESCDEFKAQ